MQYSFYLLFTLTFRSLLDTFTRKYDEGLIKVFGGDDAAGPKLKADYW